MFGRGSEHVADVEEIPSIEPRRPVTARLVNNRRGGAGPFDVDDPDGFDIEGGLDFGSLRVPMPARAQLQVEHGSGELLRAVHVLVPAGRVSLSALAAPRSSPLWRDLAEEIAESLAKDGARVWAEWGSWGREVLAGSKGALSRFIGVDGPRWMLYGVATGPADDAGELVETLREMIKKTVVTRGPDPLPVKTVLPLRLPEHLEERVEQAREQSARLSGGEAVGDAVVPVGPTGLAEEPDADPGPFPVEPYAEPFAQPRPAEPAHGAPVSFPAPLAPVRPVAAPPPSEYGASAQRQGWGSPGQRSFGAEGGGVPGGGVPAAPARIGNPGQPAGPGGAPSRPAAAHAGAHPAGQTSAPARHPSSPPGSLHPSSPPGSLHRSIGLRPSGPVEPAGYLDAGGRPSRSVPPAAGPLAGSPTGALTQSGAHRDRIPDSWGLDRRGADARGGAYGGAGGRAGVPGGDRRRGLPPVPTTAELDTNGFRRPGVEATWSLAKPVVSADQVAQQPAWALLSDAPAFWPHPTPPRGNRVPEPPNRGALDDAGGHAGPPRYPAGPAPSRPAAPRAGVPSDPAGQPYSSGHRYPTGQRYPERYWDGQQYSDGQPSGPHRRGAVPDPASQPWQGGHPGAQRPGQQPPGQPRSAGHAGGQPPLGQHLSGQHPSGQHLSGQYVPGRPPGHYPPAQPPGPRASGNPYTADPYTADPYAPDRRRTPQAPAGPPPRQPPRGELAYPAGRPGGPADGAAVLGAADSLHLALTQDAAVTGERAALIDRSGRHRRPDQPGRR